MMQRRSFLKQASSAGAGVAAARSPLRRSPRPVRPKCAGACATSFPKLLDTLVRLVRVHGEARCRTPPAASSRSGCLRRAKSCRRCRWPMPCSRARSSAATRASYYYIGKNTAFAFETTMPFGLNCAPAERLAVLRRWSPADRRVPARVQHRLLPDGQYRRADGRLVPQGDQVAGRSQGPEDADSRIRRTHLRGARCGSAEHCRWRDLPGARARARSTLPSGSARYDDEKLGFYKVAKNYYYPGWWEPSATLSLYINVKAWEALPADYRRSSNPRLPNPMSGCWRTTTSRIRRHCSG